MPNTANGVTIGRVVLNVHDLELCSDFYQQAIGLQLLLREDDATHLGAGERTLIVLQATPDAPRSTGTTGLYHMAFLLPTRRDLAGELQHLIQDRVRLAGMSDHIVSEALYLADPEGNGIEIYADRPRGEWRWINGEVDMQTSALDTDDLFNDLGQTREAWTGIPPETIMGHVHLRVSDLESAGSFYSEILGLDVTTRSYPGALFLSKDGYHHHVGLNTWRSEGAPAAAPGSPGLDYFEFLTAGLSELSSIRSRALEAGLPVKEAADGALFLTDPSGNRICVITDSGV